MVKRPLILVTNDDGISSKGIRVLIEEVAKLGEVFVVAPDGPNSGMGHAITVDKTIHIKKSHIFEDIQAYECSGTPADCVKLAKHELLSGRHIDLVVSGINHGSNLSISVLYSGTMSAAIEASIEGIPSIGFSLNDFKHDADFEHTRPYLTEICEKTLSGKVPKNIALNVNFPKIEAGEIKGIKTSRQANGYWHEEFDARKDPYGRQYYWMGGAYVNREPQEKNHDVAWVEAGYVSIVPCKYDLTDYEAAKKLSELFD